MASGLRLLTSGCLNSSASQYCLNAAFVNGPAQPVSLGTVPCDQRHHSPVYDTGPRLISSACNTLHVMFACIGDMGS